jgi:hypothetical protein
MALVQQASARNDTSSFTVSLTGTTAGNAILAGGRWGIQTLTAVSDNVNGSYGSALVSIGNTDPLCVAIYGFANGAGGNITVTFTTSGNDTYGIGWVGEYSGIATSSMVDVTATGTGTGVTDLVSNALTTSVSNDIIVVLASQNALATYSAGTNYTLDGNATGSALGIQERTVSGTLSSEVQHFTSNVSNQYAMAIVALKPSGGGGGGTNWGPWIVGNNWNRLVQS